MNLDFKKVKKYNQKDESDFFEVGTIDGKRQKYQCLFDFNCV